MISETFWSWEAAPVKETQSYAGMQYIIPPIFQSSMQAERRLHQKKLENELPLFKWENTMTEESALPQQSNQLHLEIKKSAGLYV